jgi:hypothetical protein
VEAAGQRVGGDVDMTVDEAGRQHESPSVQRFLRRHPPRNLLALADSDYPVAPDRERAVGDHVTRGVHRDDRGAGDQKIGGDGGAGRMVVHGIPLSRRSVNHLKRQIG